MGILKSLPLLLILVWPLAVIAYFLYRENDRIGAYITYQRETLPDFLIWKMLGESEYVVGLEPRTTSYGGPEIKENNKYVALKSFEEYRTKLKFEVRKK